MMQFKAKYIQPIIIILLCLAASPALSATRETFEYDPPAPNDDFQQWMDRRTGNSKELMHGDQPILVDEEKVLGINGQDELDGPQQKSIQNPKPDLIDEKGWVQKNSSITDPFVANPKPGHINEKDLVEKNVSIAVPFMKDPKPKHIDEEALAEKNVGMIEPFTSNPKPDHIREGPLVEKNVSIVAPFVKDPKPSHLQEGNLAQKNVAMIDWVTTDPKPKVVNEQSLVEKNVSMINPVTEKPKPAVTDEGDLAKDNVALSENSLSSSAIVLDDEALETEETNALGIDLNRQVSNTSSALVQDSISKSSFGSSSAGSLGIGNITQGASQAASGALGTRPRVSDITGGIFK